MPYSEDELRQVAIPHLTSQFERGLPILFTGSGFSSDASTSAGFPIPMVSGLKESLWAICFPGKPLDTLVTLQDLFEFALLRHRTELAALLTTSFTCNPDSLPHWYSLVFRLAWFRVYTLNIDDLEQAVQRRFEMPRQLAPISATTEMLSQSHDAPVRADKLDVVHLNGKLSDGLMKITFSVTQYAQRLASSEPWYVRLASELLTHSFVFIGTQLDESPLWQHIEMRSGRGRQVREKRPRSYLVTPQLNPAREALLADFNIVWIPMFAHEFADSVLAVMEEPSDSGRRYLNRIGEPLRNRKLDDAAVVSVEPPRGSSEYLLGAEPEWADVQTGRAIARKCDAVLFQRIDALRAGGPVPGVLVITGTAGSGKSTALLKCCLHLVSQGVRVGWADRELGLTPREIRLSVNSHEGPDVVVIDDADLYGGEISSLTKEISSREPYPLVILGIRSSRIDRVLSRTALGSIPIEEFSMPPLEDSDIDSLLDVLARENLLGLLKGKGRAEQRHVFRELSGRQLLVAMIRATSGKDLKEKAVEELGGLAGTSARIYGLVSLASAHRLGLFREEIIFGVGELTNTALNDLDNLVRRNLLREGHDGAIYTRHRLIAELVRDELQRQGDAKELIFGLAQIGATKVNQSMPRNARPWRILRAMINHEFLLRSVGVEVARNLYGELVEVLNWDYHYWLQRGSLEVENGDLSLAQNFLDQAKALSPEDPFVDTERAYLAFRQANADAATESARQLADEATQTLQSLIARYGDRDPYPYHVLGSQALAWSRRAMAKGQEKAMYLQKLVAVLSSGVDRHPRDEALANLLSDVQREHLSVAIN